MKNYGDHSFDFGISNPDGKPLQITGELSKNENRGIRVFGTSDSTFTLRWFNDRSAFNEHQFPYQTNIDEQYEQVNDSTDKMLRAMDLLQMNFGIKKHRLQVRVLSGAQQRFFPQLFSYHLKTTRQQGLFNLWSLAKQEYRTTWFFSPSKALKSP